MKPLWIIGPVSFFLSVGLAFPQNPTLSPNPTITPAIPRPIVLKSGDRISDSDNSEQPNPPPRALDGSPLSATNEIKAPRGPALQTLENTGFITAIIGFNRSENGSKTYNWHTFNQWDYCHYPNGSKQWYGWKTGDDFTWLFFKAGHFWWHDLYAERWLYLDQGYWWWQGAKGSKPIFQIYLEDGHYHSCDANGVLGEDLWTTGKEDIVTQPIKKEPPVSTPFPNMDNGGI